LENELEEKVSSTPMAPEFIPISSIQPHSTQQSTSLSQPTLFLDPPHATSTNLVDNDFSCMDDDLTDADFQNSATSSFFENPHSPIPQRPEQPTPPASSVLDALVTDGDFTDFTARPPSESSEAEQSGVLMLESSHPIASETNLPKLQSSISHQISKTNSKALSKLNGSKSMSSLHQRSINPSSIVSKPLHSNSSKLLASSQTKSAASTTKSLDISKTRDIKPKPSVHMNKSSTQSNSSVGQSAKFSKSSGPSAKSRTTSQAQKKIASKKPTKRVQQVFAHSESGNTFPASQSVEPEQHYPSAPITEETLRLIAAHAGKPIAWSPLTEFDSSDDDDDEELFEDELNKESELIQFSSLSDMFHQVDGRVSSSLSRTTSMASLPNPHRLSSSTSMPVFSSKFQFVDHQTSLHKSASMQIRENIPLLKLQSESELLDHDVNFHANQTQSTSVPVYTSSLAHLIDHSSVSFSHSNVDASSFSPEFQSPTFSQTSICSRTSSISSQNRPKIQSKLAQSFESPVFCTGTVAGVLSVPSLNTISSHLALSPSYSNSSQRSPFQFQ
jgi:hypothetical protein